MDHKMDKLLGLLGENQLVSTVGNVRDILNTDINSSIEIEKNEDSKKKKEEKKEEKEEKAGKNDN